jgi:hypothetical protein
MRHLLDIFFILQLLVYKNYIFKISIKVHHPQRKKILCNPLDCPACLSVHKSFNLSPSIFLNAYNKNFEKRTYLTRSILGKSIRKQQSQTLSPQVYIYVVLYIYLIDLKRKLENQFYILYVLCHAMNCHLNICID